MNKSKPVVFIRPNDILFSYDLIIVDIYNQLRYIMSLDDISVFRTLIESAFNENLYMYSLKYDNNGDMYFIDDITREPVKTSDYDKIIISKKNSMLTMKAWNWLYESGYDCIAFKVDITYFNHSIVDIEDGFDLFVLTFDKIYPDSYYVGRFFKDKSKVSEKVIDINKLANWFRDLLSDAEGNIDTIWITDKLEDPQYIMKSCIEYQGLEDVYTDRIMLDSTIVSLNQENMENAKKVAERAHLIGNIAVVNPFKISTLNQLYNE